MKYHFKIRRDSDALWAECIELEGCHTQADTEKELYIYMKEVLDLYLAEPEGSERIAPLPRGKIKAKNIVEIEVDPRIAFSLNIKHLRKKHKFTQQQLADMLGMKNIYSYQRLEKKSNPSLEMLARVKKIYPEFNVNKLFE
jgi:predicted RNase H-like HicB family nuclease